jgi:hypothetical protein
MAHLKVGLRGEVELSSEEEDTPYGLLASDDQGIYGHAEIAKHEVDWTSLQVLFTYSND